MSKPTSRVDALRRQGAQHRADIENKEKTERKLMNTMLSIGNVSRMSVDPLGLEKRKREETMRQFKTDFPEFTSKSVAQGIAEGTAYVDENFSETAGDDFDQKAESHYGTISAEDAPRKPQKKPWWDIGGSPHFGGQSPVQYYEEIAAGEKPSTTYSERVLRTTFRMIDDLPRNEKGEYVINGIPYSHTELVGVLQPQVMQSLHPQLLRDQGYRDDLAKSMGYNNMDALLTQLDQQLADLQKQIEADTWKQQSSVAASNPSVYIPARGMLEQTLSGEVEGLKAIRDARDQVAAMRKGDFSSGFAEGFDLRNVASFGLTGLGADVTMLGVLNKVKDGVPLTETESRMYSIYGIQQELNSIDNAIGTSLWRGIGQGVGASAELAPQFIAGMGLANRIFKGGAIAAKAGVAATRQAFNTSVWNGLKVGAMETMKVGGRAALNLGKYQVSGLIAAPLMPGTWASYAEKRQNQFKVADGQLVYTPTKAWIDLYDTLVEQSTEIASERFGGGLSDVLRSTAQQFGRALQLDKIGTAIGLGGDSKYIFGFKKSDAFRAFERNVGFSGVISEPLSEVWGDITSNVLKMAVTGNGDLSALGSLDYWKTAFAVSTIYGGALQTLTIPERVQYYKGVAELGKRKREILKKVEDKELANELEMLSIDDSLMTSAKRMADLDWSRYNIKDIAAAMDYVRTEIGLQVSMGYSEEQYNLRRFANAANYIETSAYTGIDGKDETTDIYRVVTAEGNVYTIISGDISNVEEGDDLLMAVDANGERVTLAKTKGNVLLASTVEREIQQAYTDMFSSEAVRARIVVAKQLFDNIEDDLTMDQATNIASSFGIVIPRVGDTVKLVDGREVVCELLSETAPGRFSAWYVDDKGTEWTLSLAFTDILSSVDSIGVEQKLMLGENITEQAQEELMEEEIADVSGENIGTENASRFTEGNVINTPEGQGKVLYVTDGKYVVDLNMSDGDVGEMALKEFTIEEIDALNANTVDEGIVTPEEVAAPITPTAEEVSIDDINEALNEVSDIKVIPRAKDGSVNFDAIDDPMLFAQTFADEMGSKEAAAEAVTNMRNAEAESVKKIEKASKKATSANDIVANKKKLDATKQRITFYDDVLAELIKSEESIPETAEIVTPTENVQPVAETIEPSAAEVAEQVVEIPSDSNERASLREDDGVEVDQTTPTAITPQPTTKAGLVKNDLSAKLTDRLQKTLDAMAQAMGVTVTFVDKKITTASGGKANARIIGNQVEISWKHRTAAIRFLMGHEFTHRMKDLSTEAYAAFEQSVKEYLGEEEWNKRVEELRSLYERQRVPITDELVAEEVTADFVGDMAYDEQTFDKYVESNKENTGLLASIARIFRSIADFFRNIGDKAHAKRLDNMTKKLDALIAASSKAVTNGAQIEGVRYSISEVQASAIIEAMKANAEVAPQIELTPENWAIEFGSEGMVSTPIGEVKMGANQYQKMEQPDRRTKLGMVKPTLTNPDVIIEESSKPKDGRVPERNSSYVFVKAFTNVDGSRDYMFTSVSNLRDGIEIVMSNQEKETPRIKRLLKEGKLAYINKATLPSEFTASAQGDQSTIPSEVSYSKSKDTTSSPNIQEEGAKFSLREPIFYSNAEYAVRGIKQEKATPEQWLKMIEKNGGLKAGEDKWLGLSDWLKASDKKTLTKDEVLQYIAENDIQIEEVNYADVEDSARFKELYIEYNALYYEYGRNSERAFEEMLDNYGDDFGIAFEAAGDELWVRDSEAAEVFVDINSVNDTRLQYTTDGLNNKREIALVVPTIEPWNTSDNIHFGDAGEGRAVAWIRFGETTDTEDKRVLVIDEIQSKRHQEGREKGYRDVEAEKREKAERERELTEVVLPRLAELNQLYNEKYGVGKWRDTEYDRQWRPRRVYRFLTPEEQAEHESLSIRATELQTTMPRRYGVPSAPFEKNWAELAFKRMLRYAAENGYDYVAWTTGDQQADRYDIGSVVKDIVAYDTKDADGNPIKKMKFRMNNMGTYNIATNAEGIIVKGDGEMKEGMRLSDITGKPLAEKIMNGEGEDAMVFENGKDIEAKSLEGEELHIGNEGMKAFYDQMLPSFVKKYTKKWGAEVKDITMPTLEENNTMHAVNVTDSMRESVMQGQPKFSLQVVQGVYDALKEYEATSDIETFVNKVSDVNDNIALGHPFLTNAILDYDEFGAEEFERKVRMIVGDYDDGGYAPYTAGGVKYSVSEETVKIFDAAKVKFGTTYDMREAGYILPDGSMLDFSGRHQVRGGDTSFLNGDRTVDHREISDIAYDADDNETGINTDLGDFLDRGAIRIDSNAGAINLNVAPTKAQKDRLKRLIERNDGYVYVDFGKGWDTEHYAEYEAARASRVLGDIDRYFDEGIKPTGNVHFSLQSFDDKVQFITHEANLLGVQSYVMVAENTAEYLSTLKDFGVVNPDRYEKSSGVYIDREDAIVLNGDYIFSEMETVKTLIHEHTHSITKDLKDKLKEVLNRVNNDDILAYRDKKLPALYKNDPAISVLNEIISFFVEDISYNKLIDFYHGVLDVEDLILSDFDIKVTKDERYWPLFEVLMPIIAENLTKQKDYYNGEDKKAIVHSREFYEEDGRKTTSKRRIANGSQGRGYRSIEGKPRINGTDSQGERGEVDKVENQGLWRGYFEEESVRRGGGERRLLTPTRYSVRKDDMPFFYDEGGDVIIFDDLEDAPAEYISSAEGKPRITEETLSTFIKGRHSEANMRIREETDEIKKAMKARFLDEKRKRLDGIANARSNSGKVAVILGDTAVETLSLEDQALVMIAEGEVHIVWDADKNGRKGIAGELGLSDAERTNYKSITKGATVTFEKFVHQWWESIGGYEKGIDTQDLRNALIEALSEAPTAKRAIEILRDKYDTVQREYDDAIYDIEASEERELANEEARYKQELEDINDPAKRRAYVRHYEQSVAFFDDMGAVQRTVRELESKISRLTRDAAVAQRRYERRVEAIKERNKAYTQERLDEQFEKNKAFLRKVLDERNEKLRKMAEGINEAKEAIKETLQGSKAIKYNSREVQSLIASIDGVRTAKGLKEVYSKAERIILNAGIRQARNDMQRLLNMRLPNGQMVESWVGTQVREGRLSAAEGRRIIADMWRGTNSRGVKVSKFVDEETAKVMKYLRDNLVLPYAKRHYQEMTDADGNTTKVLSPDLEITTDVATLKGNNDMRIAELEAKLVEGTLKADERTELDARRLYDSYLNVVDYKQQIEAQNKAIEEQRERIAKQREGVESGEIDASVPKESYRTLSTMYEALNDLKKSYFDKIAEFNTKVEEVLSNGRDALKEFREAQEQHRVEVIRMGLDAIGGDARLLPKNEPTVKQKLAALNRASIHNPYWTFQTTLKEIDRFAPNGEGEFYNHYMRAAHDANNEYLSMQNAHCIRLAEYIKALWPELNNKSPYNAFLAIMEKADNTILPSITYTKEISEDGSGKKERTKMRISNAMYVIAMWNQAQYKEAMQKRGITQEAINNLEAAIAEIDGRYIEFMRLVIGNMLPDTRLEYDKVHRQMFGASMENISNYFPAKVKRIFEEADLSLNNIGALPSTITGSIISRRANNAMPDITQSFFGVLIDHLQNMDHWAAYAPLIQDLNMLLSNVEFKGRLNAYMPGAERNGEGKGSLYTLFKTASAIMSGCYTAPNAIADDILMKLQKGFATANISWRISTAIKQLSAAPIFAAYTVNPKCAAIWAKNMAMGLPNVVSLFEWAKKNSPSWNARWTEKHAGSEVLARKSRDTKHGLDMSLAERSNTRKALDSIDEIISYIAVEIGMTPNAAVDAWVCAVGMKTIYDFELSRMTNGKAEEATAEQRAEAMYKAEVFMNATQQSAESAFVSEAQMQRSVVTAACTTYMNATYALHRLRRAGFQELGKQMFNKEYREEVREKYGEGALGDARKKAYAQVIQGVIGDLNFYLMGIATRNLWALLSGGEDDDEETTLWEDIKEILFDMTVQMTTGGFLGGNIIKSAYDGYKTDWTPALGEFGKALKECVYIGKDDEGEATIDGINIWAVISLLVKFRYGVDTETFVNMALGIEGIIKQEGWEAGMKLFNEPQSAINLVAGRRRKGETVQEYVERRMRLEVIGSVPSYGEMFDEDGKFIGQGKLEKGFDWGFFKLPVGGAKDYKVRNLFKEFNERQTNAVMRHVMTPMQRADIERTNEVYAKVCAELGWKTTTDPGDKGVDKTQKRYVYPQGLSAGRYKNLKKIAKEISDIRKELNRFAGSDEGYAEKLKEQHELKKKLIDKYDEFK